jgi:DNA-binding transcriptional ArsR family regulator
MKLNQTSDEGENQLAVLCRALSEPFRLKLLRQLAGVERTVSQLCAASRSCSASALAISQPMISHHLGMLRSCGLVASRHAGRWRYYALAACVRANEHSLTIQLGPLSVTIMFRTGTLA